MEVSPARRNVAEIYIRIFSTKDSKAEKPLRDEPAQRPPLRLVRVKIGFEFHEYYI